MGHQQHYKSNVCAQVKSRKKVNDSLEARLGLPLYRSYPFLPFKTVTIKKRRAILFQNYTTGFIFNIFQQAETTQQLGTASIKLDLTKRGKRRNSSRFSPISYTYSSVYVHNAEIGGHALDLEIQGWKAEAPLVPSLPASWLPRAPGHIDVLHHPTSIGQKLSFSLSYFVGRHDHWVPAQFVLCQTPWIAWRKTLRKSLQRPFFIQAANSGWPTGVKRLFRQWQK